MNHPQLKKGKKNEKIKKLKENKENNSDKNSENTEPKEKTQNPKKKDISSDCIFEQNKKITIEQFKKNVCTLSLNKKEIKLGGPGRIVEIDESLIAKVKHNKGENLKRPQVWMFGMIDRTDDRVYIEIEPDRSAFTLLAIIYDHVLPGTTIFSDSWSSYAKITEIRDFTHDQVNHKYNFVNPDNRNIHTNRIESLWRDAKSKFKDMYGCNRLYLASYIDKFMFRHNNKLNRTTCFDHILKAIGDIYDIKKLDDLDLNLLEPVVHEGEDDEIIFSDEEPDGTYLELSKFGTLTIDEYNTQRVLHDLCEKKELFHWTIKYNKDFILSNILEDKIYHLQAQDRFKAKNDELALKLSSISLQLESTSISQVKRLDLLVQLNSFSLPKPSNEALTCLHELNI
ncbi:unnamed protein product, partial [Brachionus calyciflorus]